MTEQFRRKDVQAAWVKAWQESRDEVALRHLINSCKTLIYMAINSMKCRPHDVHRDELIYSAERGIARAADLYDASRNTVFGSYAKFFIRDHMNQAIKSSGTASSVGLTEYSAKLRTEVRRIVFIAKKSGRSEDQALRIAVRIAKTNINFAKLCLYPIQCVSLNGTIGGGEFSTFDIVDDAASCEEVIQHRQTQDILIEIIEKVCGDDGRAAYILKERHWGDGRSNADGRTFQSIADEIGVTRERTRQIYLSILAGVGDELKQRGLGISDLI